MKALIDFQQQQIFFCCVLNTLSCYYLVIMISLIYCKIHCLYLPYFVWFAIIFSSVFFKSIKILIPFLSVKRITHVYLLKIWITHDKKRITLLNSLIICISARPAPQILSIKDEHTFRFLNYLVIGLCNCSAISLFDIFRFLTADLFSSVAAPPAVFLSKIL